jgi:hypothetical protein
VRMGPSHSWFWCRRRSFIQSSRCHCQWWSYPQGDPPAECHCKNCWLNKCRFIYGHHCHCCVRCIRWCRHHCRSICCDAKKHWMQQIIKYSGAALYYDARAD